MPMAILGSGTNTDLTITAQHCFSVPKMYLKNKTIELISNVYLYNAKLNVLKI